VRLRSNLLNFVSVFCPELLELWYGGRVMDLGAHVICKVS
jgi:hypothetical protein